MRAKSLKSSQILRAHMPYFRRPGHIGSIDKVGNIDNSGNIGNMGNSGNVGNTGNIGNIIYI